MSLRYALLPGGRLQLALVVIAWLITALVMAGEGMHSVSAFLCTHPMSVQCMWQDMERTVSLQRSSLKASQPPSPFAGEPEDDEADVQEVEMVLETYFMHIDNTYNKLQTLTEYIDDTEVCRGS